MRDITRLEKIEDLARHRGRLVFDLNGIDLDMNFLPAASDEAATLVIGFHGAIDRPNRPVPAFIPFLPDIGNEVHQLTIADPSLRRDPDISMAWFAGDVDFDSQKLLPPLFQSISHSLGVKRTIYFGTSGGGFAALYYSRQHPGSLALVGNPQTRIADFYPRHIEAYLSCCWPGYNTIASLPEVIESDMVSLYSQSELNNFVVYLQNSTDSFHLFGHMAPFFSSIKNLGSRKRVASSCFFPGHLGHNPVWEMFLTWLRSAIVSQDWTAEKIIVNHHILISNEASSAEKNVAQKKSTGGNPSSGELQLANVLRNYHLCREAEY